MTKTIISLTLLLILGAQSQTDYAKCFQTAEKIVHPLLMNFNSYIKNGQLDDAYTEAMFIKNVFVKFTQVCDIALPFDLNKPLEVQFLTVEECLPLIAYLVELSEDLQFPQFINFYQALTQFTQECVPYKLKSYFKLKQSPQLPESGNCAICGFLVTLIENYMEFNKLQISDIIKDKVICRNFKDQLKTTCEVFIDIIAPFVISKGLQTFNSDVICAGIGYCTGEFAQCQLHPKKSSDYSSVFSVGESQITAPWDWIFQYLDKITKDHRAVFDLDNDTFSDYPQLRGYNWKGQDCNDMNVDFYPGRATPPEGANKNADYNCNGIFGTELFSKKTWKQKLCDESHEMGTLIIGDSAGAHFSIPAQWVDVTQWQNDTFDDFMQRLSNELDLPHYGFGNGYMESNVVHSIYKLLKSKNLCNRGDYQNLCVNGQASTNSLKEIKQSFKRNPLTDKPVIVLFELIGNDVCGRSLNDMTTPKLFREKIIENWSYLDQNLPAGSHMIVVGIADGRTLYNTLHDKMHPIGVSYPIFYEYLNCNVKSPCFGWMNNDADIRDATTYRAEELNRVYREIIDSHQFKNFDIQYYDLPQEEMFKRAEALGYTRQECLEPVDGFHPSQIADFIIADILTEFIQRDHPNWIPKENPNNWLIEKLFPSQTQ